MDNAPIRMNTDSPYHSDFLGVSRSRSGLRIRNDEVVGSIPTSSTIIDRYRAIPWVSNVGVIGEGSWLGLNPARSIPRCASSPARNLRQ